MFRNILSKTAKQQAKQNKTDVSSIGTQRTTTSGDSMSTKCTTVSAMKKGRKKLSSMMDSLQRSSRRLGLKRNKKNGEKKSIACNYGHNNLPYEFASDDDEEAYKSAEENTCYGNDSTREVTITEQKVTTNQPEQHNKAAEFKDYYVDEDKFVLPEEQCDIPTFLLTKNCDPYLIGETRRLLKERFAKNPDSFYENDYKRMMNDDWTVTRFLLRRRLDPKRTVKLMEECGRFRKQYKMSEVQLWEFPIEFHKAGGLFRYAPDRVGNITMYMRVKMYRRVPEISDVFKAFILCVLEQCDVANNGRGTAVIFDLSGCGLQNVDLGFLSWLLSSFRNYCPKGVSYIVVYNLPWILNATCKLAMTWMSASNRRALRFVHGAELENFIARENLPDYCGGTCKLDYRRVPEGSKPAIEVCDRLDMTKEQALKIRELFKDYLNDDYDKVSEKTAITQKYLDAKSCYDDARSTILDNLSEQQHQQNTTLANHNQAPVLNGNNTASQVNSGNAKPVVDLVSQASRFIAQ